MMRKAQDNTSATPSPAQSGRLSAIIALCKRIRQQKFTVWCQHNDMETVCITICGVLMLFYAALTTLLVIGIVKSTGNFEFAANERRIAPEYVRPKASIGFTIVYYMC